ncbi:MAG: FxsA family protein [Planctomycetota bacterium]
MLAYLLLLFTAVPLAEFVLLSWLSDRVGLLATIGLVLVTGAVGATLARQQGLQTLLRIRQETAAGRLPGDALVDGALILLAGAVLITPGMLTDAVGFGLLAPPVRAAAKKWLAGRFAGSVNVQVHTANAHGFDGGDDQQRTYDSPAGGVIDAEAAKTRVEEH